MKLRPASVIVLLCCGGFAWPMPAHAQELERIFSDANAEFFHGDFERSIEAYERLVEAGVQDADVYFNLATANARADRLGRAVLYFERALWLRPGDESTEHELAAARSVLGRRRAERDGQATLQSRPPLVEALLKPLSADLLAGSLLAVNTLFFGVLLVRRRVAREAVRLGLAVSLPLLAVAFVLCAAGLAVRTEVLEEGRAAIVLRDEAAVREGPDNKAQVRAKAQEGQSARVLMRSGNFARVQLAGGALGWMSHQDIGLIRPN